MKNFFLKLQKSKVEKFNKTEKFGNSENRFKPK